MASLAMAFPILPGKTEQWKHFCQEMAGPRRSEYEASNKRIGATRAALYLQQTPQGDIVVVYQEAADMQHFFEAMVSSKGPYFICSGDKGKEVNGVNFSNPLPVSLPDASRYCQSRD